MYVDESGDPGPAATSPSRHFVLTGIVIHELRWNEYIERIVRFRQRMRDSFGLLMREEIHAAHFINRPGALARIKRNDRAAIIKFFANELATCPDLNVINVVVNKVGKPPEYDVTTKAWSALVQRFENTIARRNFRGPANADERGMIVPDAAEVKKITQIMRRMRRYNPIPNQQRFGPGYRNLTVENIIEDPFFKDSRTSYLVQAADVCAFLLYQSLAPSAYARSKSLHHHFARLDPILCKVASSADPAGVVRL